MPRFRLDFNIDGIRIIWHEGNYQRHYQKHPEVRHRSFLEAIIECRRDPDYIFKSNVDENVKCYYLKSFTINDSIWYIKVMIDESKHPSIIKTAFRVDNLKEWKYGPPIYQKA